MPRIDSWNPKKKAMVISAYVNSKIEDTLDFAFLYDDKMFLKKSSDRPEIIYSIRRLDADWDGFFTSIETPFSMMPYYDYLKEFFGSAYTKIMNILKNSQRTTHPDNYMEEYQTMLRGLGFNKSIHELAEDFASNAINLAPGAQDFLIELKNMEIELNINSGCLKGIIEKIVEKRELPYIDPNRIKASVKYFRDNGSFDYLDWNLGYRKETKSSPYRIVVSDNSVADAYMPDAGSLTLWTEGETLDDDMLVESLVPESRYNMMEIIKKIRRYDMGILVTSIMSESQFEEEKSRGNNLESILEKTIHSI